MTSIQVNSPEGVFLRRWSKEPKLELSVETRQSGDITIVHCEGRVVFRDEAVVLSRVAKAALGDSQEVIIDLGSVLDMDSAGLGELVFLHMAAEDQGRRLKLAGANSLVSELFGLTRLSSVFESFPSVEAALAAQESTGRPQISQ
jgi:anti-sigma B factor antagonist